MAILDFIQVMDVKVFSTINQDLSSTFLDYTLLNFRNKYFWAPLYIYLIVKTIVRFKKHSYIILLVGVLSFMIADLGSSKVIKPTVERIRPCNEITLSGVLVKAPCRNSYSFVSSHAMNHMALATFFFFIFFGKNNRWPQLLFIWAIIISFAQVYVGLHYPSDVIVGMVLGFLISYVLYKWLKIYYIDVYSVRKE